MISVLFVDDEPALLEITRLFLERSGEMKVDTSRSALEAIEKLKSRRDAVLRYPEKYKRAVWNDLKLLRDLYRNLRGL